MAVAGYHNLNYGWAVGHITETLFLSDDANLLKNFPVFADMGGGVWPSSPAPPNFYNQAAQLELTLGGKTGFVGRPTFTWSLQNLTPQMMQYVLHTTRFQGGASMDSTISHWNASQDRWEIDWVVTSLEDVLEDGAELGYVFGGALRLTVNHLFIQAATP